MATLGNSAVVAGQSGRKKTNRKMFIYGAVGAVVLMLGYLALRSPDLGKSAAEHRAQERHNSELQQQYQARVQNPNQAAKSQYDAAVQTIRNQEQKAASESLAKSLGAQSSSLSSAITPPGGASLPPPLPASGSDLKHADSLNMESYQKARREVQGGGDEGGGQLLVSGTASPDFIVYAAPDDDGKDGSHLFSIKKPGEGASKGTGTAAADAEAQRQFEAQQAAQQNDPQMVAARQQAAQAAAAQAALASANAKANDPGAGGTDLNAQWLYRSQNDKVKPDEPIVAKHGLGRYWIAPGTAINAVTVTAIDTRLPGQFVARVTTDIYDSRYGQFVVIPAGAVISGHYNSVVKDGQNRVMAAATTLVTPAGGTVPLQGMAMSDQEGMSGIPGKLHTHFLARMSIALLYGAEASALDRLSQTTVISPNGTTSTNSMSSGAQIVSQAANEQIKEMFALGPNITVKPGVPIVLITDQGIEVPPIANTR